MHTRVRREVKETEMRQRKCSKEIKSDAEPKKKKRKKKYCKTSAYEKKINEIFFMTNLNLKTTM